MFRVCNVKMLSESLKIRQNGAVNTFYPWAFWVGLGKLDCVIKREDLGSWLNGVNGNQDYPGQAMGRPQSGPGSVARFGRRLLALIVDWYLCWGVLALLGFGNQSVLLLVVFWAYMVVAVGFAGHTVGHFALGMQVQTLAGKPAGWVSALIRASLIMLIIPVLIMDENQRGLHDKIRGTILVRFR